ncbi:ATP-grasp domain-containing protein [Marinobacter nauticus]
MTTTKANVFVFGADEFNLNQIQALETGHEFSLHPLFDYADIREQGLQIEVERLYQQALNKLDSFTDSVDAIVGYWDFPISTLLPLLRERYNLPSPSLEAVLKCEHKYWSRVEQSKVVPEYIPNFCAVDPFAEDYREQISLEYPFWIKPVKGASSYLAFKVKNDAELDHAIERIRKAVHRYGSPFNEVLQHARVPEEVASVDGNHCLAEGIISSGRQCTLEGCVLKGQVSVHGIIDSVRAGKHRSSFARYQYPSTIPKRVQKHMLSVTERFLRHIEYDNGPFNIEFYWNRSQDSIRLLEVNTRISKSHSPLFRKVDGEANHKIMVETALGRDPKFPHRRGKYPVAAKFMWRVYEDARVTHVPAPEELEAVRRRFRDVDIELYAEPGKLLSTLEDQDSYSFELAALFIGAENQKVLRRKYEEVKAALNIRLEPLHDQPSSH